jgi:hypothetical protein
MGKWSIMEAAVSLERVNQRMVLKLLVAGVVLAGLEGLSWGPSYPSASLCAGSPS